MRQLDVVIAGAGIIGLTCALELRDRGLSIAVVERGKALREASWAAAGMLAAHDQGNPAALQPLAELSLSLYPKFLARIESLSGIAVPFETHWTLEAMPGWRHHRTTLPEMHGDVGFRRIAEWSLDPRKLGRALMGAVKVTDVVLAEETAVRSAHRESHGILVKTTTGDLRAICFLDTTGVWSSAPVRPIKGQLLRVEAPGALAGGAMGNIVVRTPEVYMVPRLDGSVVIGATLEDAGFDRTLDETELDRLHERAAALVPALRKARVLERWSGLRPDTPDHLPLLGKKGPRSFVAAGHFRNGVLLAPATAQVMTELMLGETPSVELACFDPNRFAAA